MLGVRWPAHICPALRSCPAQAAHCLSRGRSLHEETGVSDQAACSPAVVSAEANVQ